MEYRELKSEIERGELAPVYFFYGEEVYLIEELVRRIVEKGTEPGTRDFNCDVLQGEEVDGKSVVGLAYSFPMMTERRVVVLKSMQKLSSSDKKQILEYVRAPLESTCLVLVAGKVDSRQSFYANVMKHSRWTECKGLYENQAVEWAKRCLRSKGVTLSHEGATLLVQQVGTSLWGLFNEIEKLLTFCWEKKNLELEDVAEVVGFSRKYNRWELTDAVGRKDLESALVVLKRLMEEGQSPAGLIMDLTRRVFLLMQIRVLSEKGLAQAEVAKTLNLRPYFMRLYMDHVRRFTTEELERAVTILLRADLSIKTGTMHPNLAMTLVVHDLVWCLSKTNFF